MAMRIHASIVVVQGENWKIGKILQKIQIKFTKVLCGIKNLYSGTQIYNITI